MTPSKRSVVWWQSLSRGWKSVVVSLLITALASVGPPIPW